MLFSMLFPLWFRFLNIFFLNIAYTSSLVGAGSQLTQYVRYQEPEFLTFEELKKLVKDPHPGGRLEAKLEKFWTTPIISNEAWYRGVRPRNLENQKLGKILSVASWNIEKSFNVPAVADALKFPDTYIKMIDAQAAPTDSKKYRIMLRQRQRLIQSDILILQEMDIGHSRSDYVNSPKVLAEALDMNYAYGAEQLEIDPVYLGTEDLSLENQEGGESKTHEFAADPRRYKGVFGSAVLSKYPIKHVEVFQLKNQAYDWYYGEKPKIPHLESARRLGTRLLFKNQMTRELKIGGRHYFRVDLEVPELPGKTLTIINIHLEIKCQPVGREMQMLEILSYIKDIQNPVIVMGDFNAAPTDISPTSTTRVLKRAASKPETWLNAAVTFLTPYGPTNIVRGASNVTKNLQDPTAKHIPVVAPNAVKKMFDAIESFRFSDGGAFDFRGDSKRSMDGKNKKLANSNQRDRKGFKTTFQVQRPIAAVIGKLRLDWAFVKSHLKDPEDVNGPYQFAPHFGETLEEFNVNLLEALSDHHPNVVDLPFEEPEA